jgi:hypothetical protein
MHSYWVWMSINYNKISWVHFIYDVIKHLIDILLLKHINFITYYPQGNGFAKSTNKVLGTLLTKLVIENWDEHLSIIFFLTKQHTK